MTSTPIYLDGKEPIMLHSIDRTIDSRAIEGWVPTNGTGVVGRSQFAGVVGFAGQNEVFQDPDTPKPQLSLNFKPTEPTGVAGFSDFNNGKGVFGHAVSPTGDVSGVMGWADSPNGKGVNGWARATSGSAVGVYGGTSSPTGTCIGGFTSVAGAVCIAGWAGAPGVIPIVARGSAGQTASLQEWRDVNGAALAGVEADGTLTAPKINAATVKSGTVQLWNWTIAAPIPYPPGRPATLVFKGPDGKTLASLDTSGNLHIKGKVISDL